MCDQFRDIYCIKFPSWVNWPICICILFRFRCIIVFLCWTKVWWNKYLVGHILFWAKIWFLHPMFSDDCDHLYKAWNVAVRLACNVSFTTHRCLIEPISQSMHLKVMLTSRYVNFVRILTSSPKYAVWVLVFVFQTWEQLWAALCRT